MSPANTILLDPNSRKAALAPFVVRVISRREAYAEKIRAACCRREVAIRDFYDLDHAFHSGILDRNDEGLFRLAREKMANPGNDAPNLSPHRIEALRQQVQSHLRPVLREQDFIHFQLDRIVAILTSSNLAT